MLCRDHSGMPPNRERRGQAPRTWDEAECARRYRAIRELMDALPLEFLCPRHLHDACAAIWVEVEGWELDGYPHERPSQPTAIGDRPDGERPGRQVSGRRSVRAPRAPRGRR